MPSSFRQMPDKQAAREAFDPACLNHTLSKVMIRKLREDWTGLGGGKPAWQSFHTEFLKYGGTPIPTAAGGDAR